MPASPTDRRKSRLLLRGIRQQLRYCKLVRIKGATVDARLNVNDPKYDSLFTEQVLQFLIDYPNVDEKLTPSVLTALAVSRPQSQQRSVIVPINEVRGRYPFLSGSFDEFVHQPVENPLYWGVDYENTSNTLNTSNTSKKRVRSPSPDYFANDSRGRTPPSVETPTKRLRSPSPERSFADLWYPTPPAEHTFAVEPFCTSRDHQWASYGNA
jgi:hypothetical protein